MSLQPSAASIVAQDKRSRRSRRRWLVTGSVVTGLLLFGFFGLPPIIKAQAIKHLSAELHREVSIERIRVNPLVLSITIDGLAIKDRDGAEFTGWRRLYVNFDSFSLFTGEWRFQEIYIDGFSQRVVIAKDGVFNFADLIPAPAEAPATPAKKPRPLRIASLSVTSAALNFVDSSRAAPFATTVGPLGFTLKNFHTAGDPKAPYEFSAITEAGETFDWKGTLSLIPARSAGRFSIGGIALKKYAPYYADRINADLLSGALDFSASYAVDLSEGSRQLTLGDATIKLSNLQVAPRGSTTAVIDLPSLVIDGLHADGLKTSAVIRRVALDGGRLTVVREKDGSINLLNLLTVPAVASAGVTPVTVAAGATPAAAMPALPDVKLTEFSLTGLAIDIEDRTTLTPAKNSIGRLDVSVKNISLAEPAVPVLLALSVATLPSGTINVEGSAVREPLAADLKIKVTSIPLAGGTPYIEPMLNVRIAGGAVSVDGQASLRGTVASFQGDVVVDKFATVDGAKAEDFVTFTQFAIRGIDAISDPLTARIGEISITDPSARVTVNADKTTNLAAILRTETAPAAESEPVEVKLPPAAPAKGLASSSTLPAPIWSLGKFTLTNGSVLLADNSIKPAVRMSLDHFSGAITGLSSADLQRADVNIRGKVNGSGEVSFTGKLDAKAATLTPGALTEILVDVKGVDLSPISPYVGTYAGYELARSGLSVDVKARLSQRKLDTSNVITLKQFTFGPATNSPDATKLPVRLGVALLKDTSGNIVIDVPVKGSLDDPSFKIGRVVLRVIVNLLVKAATSPFSLIGAAFGGGGDELAYQDFSPGATTPLEAEIKKIETLRKALKGRPALNLDINGSYDATADLAAVRDQTLAKQVRQRLWEELRVKNADTPPPSELTVAPEDETRIIGLMVSERYPDGLPAPGVDTAGASVTQPQAVVAAPPAPTPAPRRIYSGAATPKPVAKTPAVKTVVIISSGEVVATASADGSTPLTLADARRALASGIVVSEEDLRALAEARAQHVRDELLEGGEIDAGRLFLTAPAPAGKGAKVFLQLR
ncbi:DUF748 domain-containing protein [Rariglobus hedericola]|uniref:DUF748 domain-containing protein n=1 Tax=Rariglobus hedericola TaxID=2597822 RepID=A0A556QKN8_9BACT|nr:DUF748 domain-containing protein [Rariglobus hedericola]TSJ77206.1 DUF748 domain-containing protein [Rariglobus hedericola]